ncbi:PH domain-containing protein [Nonomuraea africana]|uniref:Membrane protein n=1 Tax=Nonomuraea africana TaxID=46171 RepID=A0ABR9KHV7_9ACTN|nr:PH domain-containing protein [Nonomuraea africana]MBE1561608.1 putative membrane protein [Nonomuraea africana]
MITRQDAAVEVAWSRLHGRVPFAAAVLSLAVAAPAAVGATRFLLGRDLPYELVAAGAAGVMALVVAAAYVHGLARLRTTRFRLTAERLEVCMGILTRQHRAIPRDRVRSVDVKADVVRRAFGLAVVKIGTGEHTSGESAELTLNGLAAAEAEALRRTLLSGVAAREAPLEEDGQAIAGLKWQWIRYAPLSIWVFVGGAVAIGALKKVLDILGVDVFSTSAAKAAWEWLTANPWVSVPVVVAGSALVGLVGAVALFAETWGGYRLEREAGTLRVRRGLLTTRSLTLETGRLRGVAVAEPLLLRLGGGAKVRAVAVGLRKAEDNESEEVSALTPPIPRAEAVRVASRILHASPVAMAGGLGDLLPHPKAARGRRVRLALATVAALAAAMAGVDLLTGWVPVAAWALPLIALPLAPAMAVDAYRGLGHRLTGSHLLTRAGSVLRTTVALDRGGIVGWRIRQSFFQRRLGLITVAATTAAGDGHYDVLDVGTSQGLDLAAQAVPGLLEPFLLRRG